MTYPNILVLDYLKRSGKATPQVRMKAEQYLNLGYQRLLTFRNRDGGFNLWGGNDPSQTFLTAYGLMQFADMSKVRMVDANIIRGAQEWLAGKQQADGSWTEVGALFEGFHSQPRATVPFTAWVVWALAESGERSVVSGERSAIDRGLAFLREHIGNESEPYNLALCANAFAAAGKADEAQQLLAKLDQAKVAKGKACYWHCSTQTFTYGARNVADIETTALATYALVRSKASGDTVTKALAYLIEQKDQSGAWHSTQATIHSLKALIAALGNTTEHGAAKIEVVVNDETTKTVEIREDQSDVVQLIDLKEAVRSGANTITLKARGEGKPMFQVIAKYWVQGSGFGVQGSNKDVEISVDYDRSSLKQNDTVRATAKVIYKRNQPTFMLIADLGIAPGFTPLTEDLDALVAGKVIQRYETTGRQIVVYLDKVRPGKAVRFSYRLKAKFPVRAQVPSSRAYDYYNPSVESRTRAKPIVVSA